MDDRRSAPDPDQGAAPPAEGARRSGRPTRPAVLLVGVIVAVMFALLFRYDVARALDGAQALSTLLPSESVLDASVSSRVGMTVCLALIVAFHITTMVSLGLQIHLLLSCLLCAVTVGMLWAPPADRYAAADDS